jgi:hypothetical protein
MPDVVRQLDAQAPDQLTHRSAWPCVFKALLDVRDMNGLAGLGSQSHGDTRWLRADFDGLHPVVLGGVVHLKQSETSWPGACRLMPQTLGTM